MNNFDEILNGASAKLDAEKQMAKELLNNRVKTLSEFAKTIYEFIEFVNENYVYTNSAGTVLPIFIYCPFDTTWRDLRDKPFSAKVASNWARLDITSSRLNNRIELNCDDSFNVTAFVGKKSFSSAEDLIKHVAYLIAEEKLERKEG